MSPNLCDEDGYYLTIWRGLVPSVEIFGRLNFAVTRAIKADVARKHGLTAADLEMPHNVAGARRPKVTRARQEAMWMMRQVRRPNGDHKLSYPQIGAWFGRDNATIFNGVKRYPTLAAQAEAA